MRDLIRSILFLLVCSSNSLFPQIKAVGEKSEVNASCRGVDTAISLLNEIYSTNDPDIERTIAIRTGLGDPRTIGFKLYDSMSVHARTNIKNALKKSTSTLRLSGVVSTSGCKLVGSIIFEGDITNIKYLNKLEKYFNNATLDKSRAEAITGRKINYGPNDRDAVVGLVNKLKGKLSFWYGMQIGKSKIEFIQDKKTASVDNKTVVVIPGNVWYVTMEDEGNNDSILIFILEPFDGKILAIRKT